jgi:nucleoside-diphosphate-sugar epimerase
MRVFVAGATGVLGRPLVRKLVERGHDVVGLTRTAAKQSLLEEMGARAAVADALDEEALRRAVQAARPTHVVHLLTALPVGGPVRPRDLRATNRVRTEGTAHLIRAAREAGARRLVAESFLGVYGRADFDRPRSEDGPLPPPGSGRLGAAVLALRALERQLVEARVAGLETVALRYGLFYGPGIPALAGLGKALRARKVFVPRGATGVASFIHVDDAVTATLAALAHPSPSATYNVVDDEPIALTDYLAAAAAAFGAPAPRAVPAWVVGLAAPVIARAAFTRVPLSNAKARAELGWRPAHPSVREALAGVVAAMSEAA